MKNVDIFGFKLVMAMLFSVASFRGAAEKLPLIADSHPAVVIAALVSMNTGWRFTLEGEAPRTYIATEEPNGWKGKIFTTGWTVWPAWESWNYEGWEGKPVTVVVMSREPQISLYLNGRLVETRANGAANDWHHKFKVPYEPGELKAVAGGETAALRTAGAFDHWEFSGEPIATCSGDVADPVVAASPRRKAFHGRVMAVYRGRRELELRVGVGVGGRLIAR